MSLEDLLQAVAQQGVRMEQLAQEGIASVPPSETVAAFVRLQRAMLGWNRAARGSTT